MNKMVSVLLFSFNKLHLFKEALDSILCQDYSPIELIITDDCSKEFDENMILYLGMPLEEYVNINKNSITSIVIVKNDNNIGLIKNTKRACDECKGEYIINVHADDALMGSDAISKCIFAMESNSYDVLAIQREGITDDSDYANTVKYHVISDYTIKQIKQNNRRNLIINNMFTNEIFIIMHTKKIYYELDFYNLPFFLNGDYYRNYLIFKSSAKIGILEEPIYKYRLSGNGMGQLKNKNMQHMLFKADHYLSVFAMEEFHDYKNSLLLSKNKKVIVWGASGSLQLCYDNIIKHFSRIHYIVDNDKSKHGALFNDVKIYPVNKLLDEDKNDIVILVCSTFFYISIIQWLIDNGFKEGFNVFNYSEELYQLLLLK